MEGRLQKAVDGDRSALDGVIAEFEGAESSEQAVALLRALGGCAALIAAQHAAFRELLGMLYDFKWECDDEHVLPRAQRPRV